MSNIRFFKATPLYEHYLKIYADQNSEINSKPYAKQYNSLTNDAWGASDYWKKHMESRGDFEVREVISNSEFLQKKWAKENKVNYSEINCLQDILEAQILEFKPHILYAHDYGTITPQFRSKIKKLCPELKLILAWDGIQYKNIEKYENCDVVLSCVKETADFYNQNSGSIKGYYFQYGFENSILNKIKQGNLKYNFSFIGSLFLFNKGHNQRLHDIAALSRKLPMDIFVSVFTANWHFMSAEQIRRLIKFKFQNYLDVWQVGKNNKGGVFGLNMYQTLADSKITFNCHIDAAGNNAANIRLFEATGAGTCLITDWKENLRDFFEIDKEVVTYKTINECIDKVNYLLTHEKERNAIAAAGQKRTLSEHSVEKNINRFADYIIQYL